MSARLIHNANNAFIDPELHVQHSGVGPLTGLTFAAKDLFDVSTAANSMARMSACIRDVKVGCCV